MSYGIGSKVEVIEAVYLGRWIYPMEKGVIVGRHCSPAGQEVYDVELQKDGVTYTFPPDGIEEVREAEGITISEAIENLSDTQSTYTHKDWATYVKAARLGIEALKRLERNRFGRKGYPDDLLPGETPE